MDRAFQPLKKVPVYQKVYEAIETGILSGAIGEGEALPTEAELCEQLGVTRSSVREGIRALEQAGYVRRGGHKRLFVTRPQSTDIAEATSKGLARGGVTFLEVWQALATLYPAAARLAAELKRPELLEALSATHERLQSAPDATSDEVVAGAVEFFQTFAAGLENRVLLALLQSLNMLIGASFAQMAQHTPNARERILTAQAKILTALKAGDGAQAESWMRKHIDDIKRGCHVAGIDLEAPVL